MATTTLGAEDITNFASRLWLLIEELQCWPASTTKYTTFNQKLWGLCLEYPSINHHAVDMIIEELESRPGVNMSMLYPQYALNELSKIITPNDVETRPTHKLESTLPSTKNKRTHNAISSVFSRITHWLRYNHAGRRQVAELSTIALAVLKLAYLLLLALMYLLDPERFLQILLSVG